MKAHTNDMHEKEYLFPNNMIYGKSSQWTCQIWIRKVNLMTKFAFGKSFLECNMHHQTYHFANST